MSIVIQEGPTFGTIPRCIAEDSMSGIDSLVAELEDTGAYLPKSLRKAILAEGDAAAPRLAALLERDDDVLVGHAVELLGALRGEMAVPALVEALVHGRVRDVLVRALVQMRAAALEPCLAALPRAGAARRTLLGVVARLRLRDERVLAALLAELPGDPTIAEDLAEYGDARALPHLVRAAAEAGAVPTVIDQAIRDLGGTLEPVPRV